MTPAALMTEIQNVKVKLIDAKGQELTDLVCALVSLQDSLVACLLVKIMNDSGSDRRLAS